MKQIALKFLVLGDGGVGKTTLLNRYVNGKFLNAATMTIGVEFLSKQIQIGTISCQLILWDISGQDRFRFMIDKYMRGASGALLLFDTTVLSICFLFHLSIFFFYIQDTILSDSLYYILLYCLCSIVYPYIYYIT